MLLKLSFEDLQNRVIWMNNPVVYSNMNFEPPIDLENTIAWFFRNVADNTRIDFVYKKENIVVAMGGLTRISKVDENAELYVFVNPDEHGKGFGNGILKAMCAYAFLELNLNKIYLYTFTNNESANRLYTKNGFIKEGFLKQQTFKNGKLQDRILFGMLKEEWNK